MNTDRVDDYIAMIASFVNGDCDVHVFESRFLVMFTEESKRLPHKAFLVLDRLFGEVDAFCADPELHDEGDLDEVELLKRCRNALRELIVLTGT